MPSLTRRQLFLGTAACATVAALPALFQPQLALGAGKFCCKFGWTGEMHAAICHPDWGRHLRVVRSETGTEVACGDLEPGAAYTLKFDGSDWIIDA